MPSMHTVDGTPIRVIYSAKYNAWSSSFCFITYKFLKFAPKCVKEASSPVKRNGACDNTNDELNPYLQVG